MSRSVELASIARLAQACQACPLWRDTTQAVFGEGPAEAALILVGEQPGDQEDLAGRPFVGPAGRLLDQAMAELGWPREAVYVTNAVKHFKHELRGKRRLHKTPGQREIEACRPWLVQELAVVRPRAAIALGGTALQALMGRKLPVLANRGRWLQRADDGLPVLVTLHPSALLRMPPEQREAAFTQWLADLAQASDHLA